MPTRLSLLPEYTFAGHCTTGTSNKIWAAAVATFQADENPLSETTPAVYISLHGAHGGTLIVDQPKELPLKQAQDHFRRKCMEKKKGQYAGIPFAPYVLAFGQPLGATLQMPSPQGEAGEAPETCTPRVNKAPPLTYQPIPVKAHPLDILRRLLQDPSYSVSEKVDGERCLIACDGERCLIACDGEGHLRAYNREGELTNVPPAGASHLTALGCSFVIDGERLTREDASVYVPFDLLEFNGEDMTPFPYLRRITTLEKALLQAGLLREDRSTPTLELARTNSTVPDLALLGAALGGGSLAFEVIEQVQKRGGEGIVVRNLESSYQEYPFKYKFLVDIDAVVYGIKPGTSEGSLRLGIFRESDGALLDIGNLRSGFNDADIRAIKAQLATGQHPVLRVRYLPKRTIGITLVESKSAMASIRTDKAPHACTSAQFGPEKAEIIAQASPIPVPPTLQRQPDRAAAYRSCPL